MLFVAVAGGANEARLAAQPYLIGCDQPDWQVVPLTLNARMVRSLSQCGLASAELTFAVAGRFACSSQKPQPLKISFVAWV
jgi:hypothetical protein